MTDRPKEELGVGMGRKDLGIEGRRRLWRCSASKDCAEKLSNITELHSLAPLFICSFYFFLSLFLPPTLSLSFSLCGFTFLGKLSQIAWARVGNLRLTFSFKFLYYFLSFIFFLFLNLHKTLGHSIGFLKSQIKNAW